MQQAFNPKEKDLQEPASSGLRVVHSTRMTEQQQTPGQPEELEHPQSAKPVSRHSSKAHYGRSYYPDGPAGSYQGL